MHIRQTFMFMMPPP